MRPKTLVRELLIMFMLVTSCFISFNYFENCKASSGPPTLYVDDDNIAGPWDGSSSNPYRYIQDAINNSNSSYRIQVLAGTYPENIVINPDKEFLDLFAEDKSIVTITGGYSGDVITISANGVDLSGFKIERSGISSNNTAIKINANNCTIVENTISNNKHGIYIQNCNDTEVYLNIIDYNTGNGIYLENSSHNKITHTTITNSSYNGIFLYFGSDNNIENSTIRSNDRNGIYLNATCTTIQLQITIYQTIR